MLHHHCPEYGGTLARSGPTFPPGTRAPVSMLPGTPFVFSGAPPALYSAMQSARAPQGTALQPIAGALWPSQPTPNASAFMAPLAWPMYMPSYMPWPPAQQALLQAEFEELARQHQDLEVQKLEVQHMTRTRNLNAVRDVRVTTATSVAGNRHSHKKEQAPRRASSQIASQKSQTPSRAQPSGLTKR